MSWLKAEAPQNIPPIFVTAPVFQLPMSWLKAEALRNILPIFVTTPVSQLARSWLKAIALANMTLIFVSSAIAAVFGPVVEEIFFRGVMYNAVKRKLGIFWGIVITSVLFSFLHTHALEYFLAGFLPIAILTVSVGRDVFMLCRFDYMIKPVAKATKQYLVVAVPVMVILLVQWNIKQYGPLRESGGFAIGLHLSANIAVQILALLTGRALGLFYRHYSCYLPW